VLRVHDTAEGGLVDLTTRDQGRVSMYVCGPTVYDDPHIGHGRYALVFDVIRRYLQWSGYDVRFVSNVTDIDDKIIDRANREGRSADDVAKEYEQVWYDAMDRLGVGRPDDNPHATGYVERMVTFIGGLIERGHAYQTPDGVYFDVDSLPGYGLLARQPLASLRAGARVEVDEQKKSPLDFALWKAAKPDEPSWPSPWGLGRPGWHIECTVMALDLLGDGFDIHGGGEDLAFPHHENERAQALGGGHQFARHWVHNAHIVLGGEKMSKSLGNVRSLVDLLDAYDPRSYRLLVLASHYRTQMEVSDEALSAQVAALERLDAFARRTAGLLDAGPDEAIVARFRERMDDDVDSPSALAVLFDAVRAGNAALDEGDERRAGATAAAVQELCRAVGLALRADDEDLDPETLDLMARRDAARADRDFATADRLRDELRARGWVVEDGPEGTTVHR
jgi:cysteinyl-tRNA synthetase